MPDSPLPAGTYADAFHAAPVALLLIAADGLIMVDANRAYLDAVAMPAEQVLGRHVFDVFPVSDTDGFDLPEFLGRTIATGTTQIVHAVRYDIPNATGDAFETHWWDVVETPVLGPSGAVELLLHYTEEVTALVEARADLVRAAAAERIAAARVAALAEVALALAAAATLRELEVIVSRGLRVLDADGGAIVTRAPDGGWRVTINETFGDDVHEVYGYLSYDSPQPGVVVARTGQRVLLPSHVAAEAFAPEMAAVYEETGREAWAILPLTVDGSTLGALAVSWVDEREFGTDEVELLDGFAAQCAQALHRIEAAEVEHRAAREVADMAEALQQALLTPPPERGDLEIAVRYQTAVDATRVGGDWYDAFEDATGASVVVIGDVVGHDNAAAAQMGQLRGILRTLAHLDATSPAGVLTRFESTARGLRVDAVASAILARVEVAGGPLDGRRVVRWANAGHPPPILVHPDGTGTVLEPKSDLLLGVDGSRPRHDHVVDFPDGATLLLYTDGLIERRTAGLDEGIHDLRVALTDLATVPLSQLCDGLLERLAPHTGEDDIAILAVRAS